MPFSVKGLRKERGEAGEHNTPRPASKRVHSPSKLRDETIGHSIIEQTYDIPRARPLPREFGSLCTFEIFEEHASGGKPKATFRGK